MAVSRSNVGQKGNKCFPSGARTHMITQTKWELHARPRSPFTASYEVPPTGRLFHIRSGPTHLQTYSNCCQVCSIQLENSIFIFSERSKQNVLHFIYILMTIFSFYCCKKKIYLLSGQYSILFSLIEPL